MCVQWHLSLYFQYCHRPFCHHQLTYCVPISAYQYFLLELCHVIVYTASITDNLLHGYKDLVNNQSSSSKIQIYGK